METLFFIYAFLSYSHFFRNAISAQNKEWVYVTTILQDMRTNAKAFK
jgi:hypothetical protein